MSNEYLIIGNTNTQRLRLSIGVDNRSGVRGKVRG